MEIPVVQKFYDSQTEQVEQTDHKEPIQDREDHFPTNKELRDLNDLKDPNTPDSEDEQELESDAEGEKEISGVTKTIKKVSLNSLKKKKKYDTISDDLRQKLIDAVENDGQKIKHAAKKLNINYSSAKSICQVFKREGRQNKKTFKRRGPPDASDSACNSSSFSSIPAPSVSSSLVNNQEIEAEPEKDNLVILKERLLKSRISSLNSSRLSGDSSGYNDFKLNLNDDPIKRLDSMIAQNSKILGENFMPPSSTWKNQNQNSTDSNHDGLAKSLNRSWLNSNENNFSQQQQTNGGFNQVQAKNSSQQNDVGNNSGPYLQQQQQYLIATNNTNNNGNQLYTTYQPVLYYVPQQQGNNNNNSFQAAQNNLQGTQYFQIVQTSQNTPSSDNNKLNYPFIQQQSSYSGNLNLM